MRAPPRLSVIRLAISAGLLLRELRRPAQLPADLADGGRDERQHEERQQRHLPVDPEHHADQRETVAISRRNTVDSRVSASLMKPKSVVKRCVSAAGVSRMIWARSASIRWP